MTLRIWHQSFTVLEDLGAYNDAMAAHLQRVAAPGTEIVMHGMRPGTYRSDYPGHDIRHIGLQYLHSMQFVHAGLQAQREGFDAYAIATLPDPALRELRSLLTIPVVGYGESAMLTACLLGARFSILVFISEFDVLLADNARRYGLQERLCGVSDVGFRFNDVLQAYGGDPGPLIERFRAAARREIARGADVIIPGEAPLCVLLQQQGVTSVDGVPILDSLSCWAKHAEMLVGLQRQGITASRKGIFREPPPQERIDEVCAFYRNFP
ncbi:aspartate/glutamate racemase family protein [Pigmentiphaga soli]|uniref:Aspartate/glutamate racemase family protein n=1 Tax=Pigmentiphaga soli TaxID=1007095 RepID=A0ABP8HMY7_9BURK